MKRSLRVTLLSGAAALILGLGGAAVPAFAATTDPSSSSSSSSAVVSQSKKVTSELDTDPNAAISLDSAPNIDFGKNPTPDSAKNAVYNALTADAAVQVSNPGVASGYSVQVKNSPFVDAAGDTLGGAVLSLGAPSVEAANSGNPSTAPVPSALSLKGDGANALLLKAPAKGALGVWSSDFSLGEITLAVPAGQLGGSYSSTLTFQLSDTVQ